jgi:hypothetical protein
MSRHKLLPRRNYAIHSPRPPAKAWQHNGTWTINGVNLFNTPTLGSELLADPGMEAWTSATNATSYLESVAGTSTVNQETSVVHGGSNAARLDIDSSGSNASIRQAVVAAVGDWLQASAWMRDSVASGKLGRLDCTNALPATSTSLALTSTYVQFFQTVRATTTAPTPTFIRQTGSISHSIYIDDVSCKILTLNTLFAVRVGVSLPASVVAQGMIALGNWCGVVYGLDSIGTPTNCIIAIHDGVTGIRIDKMVAGVWSTVLTTTATYIAGVLPQVKWVSANTFGLWYNGIQRGANQTISDAGTGTLHGAFSTSPLNKIYGVYVS